MTKIVNYSTNIVITVGHEEETIKESYHNGFYSPKAIMFIRFHQENG
ncbi:MAG: hypothetical protein U9R17_12865 [Thermodesulfobacteriota bacterium]|nr:hypothetical protein [Thermodesulfobacteriota bacterium]